MNSQENLLVEERLEASGPEEAVLVTELQKMAEQYEPLLAVEKKLISWSIALGIISLGLLVWISYTFFPGGH